MIVDPAGEPPAAGVMAPAIALQVDDRDLYSMSDEEAASWIKAVANMCHKTSFGPASLTEQQDILKATFGQETALGLTTGEGSRETVSDVYLDEVVSSVRSDLTSVIAVKNMVLKSNLDTSVRHDP